MGRRSTANDKKLNTKTKQEIQVETKLKYFLCSIAYNGKEGEQFETLGMLHQDILLPDVEPCSLADPQDVIKFEPTPFLFSVCLGKTLKRKDEKESVRAASKKPYQRRTDESRGYSDLRKQQPQNQQEILPQNQLPQQLRQQQQQQPAAINSDLAYRRYKHEIMKQLIMTPRLQQEVIHRRNMEIRKMLKREHFHNRPSVTVRDHIGVTDKENTQNEANKDTTTSEQNIVGDEDVKHEQLDFCENSSTVVENFQQV